MNDFFSRTVISLISGLLARLVDAQTLATIKTLVSEASAFLDMTGPERRTYVLEQLSTRFQYITNYVPSWLINLVIEVIVAQMKVAK